MYNEKRYVGVIVYMYLILLCSIIPLVSLLFAVLVSLHPATFSNVFYFLSSYVIFFASRRMFKLKFAAEVSDLTGTWAVGVLALVYGQYYTSSIG